MNLLMISGDRSMLAGKQGAFWHTLEALSRHWDRVDIICPRVVVRSQFSVLSHSPIFFGNIHFHPCPRGLWNQPSWIKFRGMELAAERSYHVMTVHDYPPFYNGIGAMMLSRATNIPCVIEIHHIVGYPKAASMTESIGRAMSRVYLPFAARAVVGVRVVNKQTVETLSSWGVPRAKISVVPSFYLDAREFATLGERPPQQYDVVFCGRLAANKGADNLLRALKELPHATLLVVGDGPERASLEKLSRSLGIAPRVEFRGWLPTCTDVMRAMRSARVLVMNSSSEGGPRVPLEAMAAGVPVIATRVGVMPDVIVDGQNGLFTDGTSQDLVQKIGMLLSDAALREQMGKEGMKIIERFEREKLIARYAQFLQTTSAARS